MSLKPLIKNQNIKIDNHIRGGIMRPDSKGIHIHKRINGHKNFGKIDIRIPLNGDEEISFTNFRGEENLEHKIRSEIVEALKDKRKIEMFISEVLNWIESNGKFNGMRDEKIYEVAKNAILSLRKYFDTYAEVEYNFKKIGDKVIGHFWPKQHLKGPEDELYIMTNIKNSRISISREKEYL